MNEPVIFTMSRQFGTNGREIGRQLAKHLGIAYYDKEIMHDIANQMQMDASFFEEDNRNDNGFFSISNRNFALANMTEISLNSQLFEKSSELIKDIATKESAIIVGRCSDYILREQSNVIRVFFYSDIETRIQVAIHNHGIKAKKARKYVEMQDQKRSGFYEFYTQQTWGDPSNYDLMINTTHISIPEAIALLSAVYQAKAR